MNASVALPLSDAVQVQQLECWVDIEFLGIDSFEIHQLRYDLVFVYKMLFGFVDLKFGDYCTLRASSGHDYKLF